MNRRAVRRQPLRRFMELINWVIPVAGIAAVLFALYLARDVMSRDTGTPRWSPSATRSGRGGCLRPSPVHDHRDPRPGRSVIGVGIIGVAEADADRRCLIRLPIGDMVVPRRRGMLDGVRDHRHVRQRALERPHPPRRGRTRRSRPGRDARRGRVRLPGRGALAARRVGPLPSTRPSSPTSPWPRRRSSSSGSASARASSPSSPRLGGGIYTGRRRGWTPGWQGRGGHSRGRSA